MEKYKLWNLCGKRGDFDALSQKYDIDKVLARIIVNRDIPESEFEEYLYPSKKSFNDEHLLKDGDRACKIICEGIKEKKKFRIIGDYDIDGVCATHILKQSLLSLGANVDYYLPKRIEDGYGMNESMADKAYRDGVDIIITCDNGISAGAAVDKAVGYGMQVVVTDHHDIPKDSDGNDALVKAHAVVDPKRSDCSYPFKEICGAVVAWKICLLLFEAFGREKDFVMDLIEFAAFATVGDIMRLTDENRAIVSIGQKKMRHSKNTGLAALIEVCKLNGKDITAYSLGRIIGPCINAGGRLADASLGVELFECTDRQKAIEIATQLFELNTQRKNMTEHGTAEAIRLIEEKGYDKHKIIVVYIPGIHESLCGIISGRLKELYNRPCFMMTDGGNFVKGSGRSIECFSMTEKISECEELLEMYGGHPMASGLSLKKENIDEFRKQINEKAGFSEEDMLKQVLIDVPMPLWYISEDLINQLKLLEPMGNGNEAPVFATKGVEVSRISRMSNGKYLRLYFKQNDCVLESPYFGDPDEFEGNVKVGDKLDIIYTPTINEYKGIKTIQIRLEDYRYSNVG